MNSPQREVLITGGLGFVGKHLTALLTSLGVSVATASIDPAPLKTFPQVRHIPLDIADERAVKQLFAEIRPTQIYHLAAVSLPKAARDSPRMAFDVNVWGTRNILEAASQSSEPVRVLNVSTSQVYAMNTDQPLDEDAAVAPMGEYATTKAMSELLRWQYSPKVSTVTVRPFNHSGPGQASSFVLSYLAQQFALIEAGQQEARIVAGNLEVERDFCDVRDVVQAYVSLMELGRPDEVYNICSGIGYRLSHAVEVLRAETKIDVQVVKDATRIRAGEPRRIIGAADKLKAVTAWEPRISFKQMMIDSLDHWRAIYHDAR